MSGQAEHTSISGHVPLSSTSDNCKQQSSNNPNFNAKQSVSLSVDNIHINGNVIISDRSLQKEQQNANICHVKALEDYQIELARGQQPVRSEENREFNSTHQDKDSGDSWRRLETSKSNILRDCSQEPNNSNDAAVSLINISQPPIASGGDLINIGDIKLSVRSTQPSQPPSQFNLDAPASHSAFASASPTQELASHQIRRNPPGDSKRVRFKSLLASVNQYDSDEIVDIGEREPSITNTTTTSTDASDSVAYCDRASSSDRRRNDHNNRDEHSDSNEDNHEDDGAESQSYTSDEDNHDETLENNHRPKLRLNISSGARTSQSSSYFRVGPQSSLGGRLLNRLKSLGTLPFAANHPSSYPYTAYEDKDLLTGSRKYLSKRRQTGGRTFQGSYKYSRSEISMAITKKLVGLFFQRSTAALLGAFLIHITLGTVYTLSNINSYMTSYMRKHGTPNATYGASMWISSFYAVGQGFSMVLGGYIEKRFSARLACIIGCTLHSAAIMSTSWSISHGQLAVLMTYGFLPGFGCGLAYMTPMTNGFGWFPNRKGLVAGIILAGFGIGTFVFNIAQTAYVNPDNFSPTMETGGYFVQQSILDKVPGLFIFLGSVYACMQFIGCCLLFKPPHRTEKLADERPILETEVSLKRAIRTREFIVLFLVYGLTTQGILFVNSMLKEYGQIFIGNDMYLAWTGSMASIANAGGRLFWGVLIDRFSFTQCFTAITIIFGSLMFIMPFEFVLSSQLYYLLCTLGIFGSFSGWMSIYPVHLSRVFGRTNSGMIYGLIFVSQSLGGIVTALGAHYLIDHFNRFVPFYCVVILELLGLGIYHLFYPV